MKGRRVGRVAANSSMQRGASRVGCAARVDFSGPFAAACVATPARSFRIVDNSFDSSCKRGIINTQDVEFPVLRRYTAVQTYAGIPRTAVLQKTSHCARTHNDMQQKYKSTFINVTEKTLEIDVRTTRCQLMPFIQTPLRATRARGSRARNRFWFGSSVCVSDCAFGNATCQETDGRGM